MCGRGSLNTALAAASALTDPARRAWTIEGPGRTLVRCGPAPERAADALAAIDDYPRLDRNGAGPDTRGGRRADRRRKAGQRPTVLWAALDGRNRGAALVILAGVDRARRRRGGGSCGTSSPTPSTAGPDAFPTAASGLNAAGTAWNASGVWRREPEVCTASR